MKATIDKELVQWTMFRRPEYLQVFLLLVVRADKHGQIKASLDNLCHTCELPQSMVMRILCELQSQGVLQCTGDNTYTLDAMPLGVELGERDGVIAFPTATFKTTEKAPNKEKASARFVKPTLEEVQSYIVEKGYHFGAEEFWHHYESNGWKVGKSAMKNWHSACVTFERFALKQKDTRQGARNDILYVPDNYTQF